MAEPDLRRTERRLKAVSLPALCHRVSMLRTRRLSPASHFWSGRRVLSGLYKAIREAIGLALDRGIEHLDRVRIVLVRKDDAFRVQQEPGRLHLLSNGGSLNPMQRLGVACARP